MRRCERRRSQNKTCGLGGMLASSSCRCSLRREKREKIDGRREKREEIREKRAYIWERRDK
jgi:hypothetical protein